MIDLECQSTLGWEGGALTAHPGESCHAIFLLTCRYGTRCTILPTHHHVGGCSACRARKFHLQHTSNMAGLRMRALRRRQRSRSTTRSRPGGAYRLDQSKREWWEFRSPRHQREGLPEHARTELSSAESAELREAHLTGRDMGGGTSYG